MAQVTVVAAAALLLDAVVARRAPATSPRLLGLAAALLLPLTLAAFTPAPQWWSWHAPQSPPVETAPALAESPVAETPPLLSLTQLTQFLAVRERPAESRTSGWAVLAGVYLAGASVFLAGLALGLIQLAMVRRHSRPVLDSTLINLANAIASQMGVRRSSCARPTCRGCGHGRLAAAVILLPADWPAWPADDRVAVLAHELATSATATF